MTGTHDDIATLFNDVVACEPDNLRDYSKVILNRALKIAHGYSDYMRFVEEIKVDEISMRECFEDALIESNSKRDILGLIHDGLDYAVFGDESTLFYDKAHRRFCKYRDADGELCDVLCFCNDCLGHGETE